jgi:F-type H+-transporting ATPase subunit delta
MRLDPHPASLLYILGDRNRLAYLGGVVEAFSALADEKLGRLRARVASAIPLDQTTAQSLANKLARATNAQVILERAVEPDLLGGVVAQVGRLTYDGSLRAQLEDLRNSLKQ